MRKKNLEYIRADYSKNSLRRADLLANPFAQFKIWMSEALQKKTHEATAFVLATANLSGMPSTRVVLLKEFDECGFFFYTNFNSAKAREIGANPQVAMNFFWPELERQVRIQGKVTIINDAKSEEYFQSRPRESQIGARISRQSQPISSRDVLESAYTLMAAKETGSIERPANWGGYCISPTVFEFWQGGRFRLHDRFQYGLKNGSWAIDRLAP